MAVPSNPEVTPPSKLVAVGTAPLKRFDPVEVAVPKRFEAVPVRAPAVLRRAFGSTEAPALRSEPAVLVTGAVERLSGRLFTMFSGALIKVFNPRFEPDKRLAPLSTETELDPEP